MKVHESGRKLLRLAWALVLLHAAVGLAHLAAHRGEGVRVSALANAYILLVIGLGPFLGLGLLHAGRREAGGAVLAATMAGALLFGVWNHFIVVGPDHVLHLAAGPWRLPFQATAVLLVPLELAGALAGLAALRARPSESWLHP